MNVPHLGTRSAVTLLWLSCTTAAVSVHALGAPVSSCPEASICDDLEASRLKCQSRREGCSSFVHRLESMLSDCDCADSEGGKPCRIPIAWLCTDPYDNRFAAAVRTLLAVESEEAWRLLASDRLRAALPAEQVTEFGPAITAARRRFLGLSTSSSALHSSGPNRYDAAMSADGDPTTAWCEGARGNGVGEWVQHVFSDLPQNRTICGFSLVPGYAKDARTYARNRRVTRIRAEPCGEPEHGSVLDLKDISWSPEPLPQHELRLPPLRPPRTRSCYRFTIERVSGGVTADACISEIEPVACAAPDKP